jgi:hypothetical protein
MAPRGPSAAGVTQALADAACLIAAVGGYWGVLGMQHPWALSAPVLLVVGHLVYGLWKTWRGPRKTGPTAGIDLANRAAR